MASGFNSACLVPCCICQPLHVGAPHHLTQQRMAMLACLHAPRYKGEVRRLQEEFRARSVADVAALREAVEQYKEQAERLEMQKALLLTQVCL